MDIATVAMKLNEIGCLFRFSHGSNGTLQFRDDKQKPWREVSRFEARMLLQIVGCRDYTLLRAAMAFSADKSLTLSTDYGKKKVNR